jgi:hypothetical protein
MGGAQTRITSLIDSIPTGRTPSVTGTRRTLFRRMSASADSMLSSGPQL